jgi:beta-lactamase class A
MNAPATRLEYRVTAPTNVGWRQCISRLPDIAPSGRDGPVFHELCALPTRRRTPCRRVGVPLRTPWQTVLVALLIFLLMPPTHSTAASTASPGSKPAVFNLDFNTACDEGLQASLEALDTRLRERHGLAPTQTAAGVLDRRTGRLAMLRPDHQEYGASVPKIGILLAYFQIHPEAARALEPQTRHELGLMIKQSSNELAAKYSQQLGLRQIQAVLTQRGLYDTNHGGGIWVGKHYGITGERRGDPLGDLSHAITVRQVLRFYLWLDQGQLVSPEASSVMREIFASPEIPHKDDKFVKGLTGRPVQVLRKAGWWEDWHHDSAIVTGPGRHYLLVAQTRHPRGDAYLVDFAVAVDDLLQAPVGPR